MKLVFVTADNPHEWNSSEWRCAVPARAIHRSGLAHATLVDLREWLSGTPVAMSACRAADVLIIQRNLVGPVLAAILHCVSAVPVQRAQAPALHQPSRPRWARVRAT